MPLAVTMWLDCRSPYSYLALEPALALEREFDVALAIKPFTLEIAGALNLADPAVVARGMRKIKYLYMDVRRFARPRGLTILGPRKVFDGTLAHLGLLLAADRGRDRKYLAALYPRFFERRIDVENADEVAGVLSDIGVDPADLAESRDGDGPARLAALNAEAEAAGVFGVPTFAVDGELFWGHDRIDLLRAHLAQRVPTAAG